MPGQTVGFVLMGALFLGGSAEPVAEPLPVPNRLPMIGPLVPLDGAAMPIYQRTNRYDVWQLHDLDVRGGFRPRVIWSPHGSYYLWNGHPYPWATVHPRNTAQWIAQ